LNKLGVHAVPRPQSLLTTRKSALWMPIFLTIFANTAASTSDGGAMRKIYGLPEVVIFDDDDVSTSIGTLYSISFGITASVAVDADAPMSTGTLSRTTSFSVTAAASVGLLLVSSMMSSSFLPSTPPFALISSAAIFGAVTTSVPAAANAPVSGCTRPMSIVDCAAALPIKPTATRAITALCPSMERYRFISHPPLHSQSAGVGDHAGALEMCASSA